MTSWHLSTHRMPAILRQDDEIHWLSRDVLSADEMRRILAQYPSNGMEAYPVSERVNSPTADDERLVLPVKGRIRQNLRLQAGFIAPFPICPDGAPF